MRAYLMIIDRDPKRVLELLREASKTAKAQGCVAACRAYPRCNNSGSFAMLAAIRRASSRVSSLAAARRPGSSSK